VIGKTAGDKPKALDSGALKLDLLAVSIAV
jgi:hypothetical protein